MKHVIIWRPKKSIKTWYWAFCASDKGSECGKTIVGYASPIPPPLDCCCSPIEGSSAELPLFPGPSGAAPLLLPLDADYSRFLAFTWSMLADLVFVAKLSSSSLMLIYASIYEALPGDVWATISLRHVSLIFTTNGSLYVGLNARMKLMILCLKGDPLGSMQLILHISIISFRAFYLTFVFLWEIHWQENSVSCS